MAADEAIRFEPLIHGPREQSPVQRARKTRVSREFDRCKYSTRLIALKLAYLGQNYNGLEHHANNRTTLPTVEEVLWRALNKACLIFPPPDPSKQQDEVNWDGCEYSKCGRTDKGVSAFGQVIGIRVRSNRPLRRRRSDFSSGEDAINSSGSDHDIVGDITRDSQSLQEGVEEPPDPSTSMYSNPEESSDFDPVKDEIPYPSVLNRLLPPDIRVLAWCPSPPAEFSARFACRERRYKYFFTQPAFSPSPGNTASLKDSLTLCASQPKMREGWLNIQAMKEAAKKFEGLHDFRNFCKVDPSKQIENFERRIFHADIEELNARGGPVGYVGLPGFQEHHDNLTENGEMTHPGTSPRIFTFTLHGSAFLWHQVRHMVAILFLIGQRLESPDLVDQLLDVHQNPRKPHYEMADDAPLVLWDCVFPAKGSESRKDDLDWIYTGDKTSRENGKTRESSAHSNSKYNPGGIIDEMWKVWRQRKIDEVLAGTLLDVMVGQGQQGRTHNEHLEMTSAQGGKDIRQRVFAGGNEPRFGGSYTPILSRQRMERVEVINARYTKRKSMQNIDGITEDGCLTTEKN